jgi:hypothetical protein
MLYRFLRHVVLELQSKQVLETDRREQRIDWAYGTAVIENPLVTKAMVERAADAGAAAA